MIWKNLLGIFAFCMLISPNLRAQEMPCGPAEPMLQDAQEHGFTPYWIGTVNKDYMMILTNKDNRWAAIVSTTKENGRIACLVATGSNSTLATPPPKN